MSAPHSNLGGVPPLSVKRKILSVKFFQETANDKDHNLFVLLPPIVSSNAYYLRKKCGYIVSMIGLRNQLDVLNRQQFLSPKYFLTYIV